MDEISYIETKQALSSNFSRRFKEN